MNIFKQKTAYEMRISDWSSDVCSSDHPHRPGAGKAHVAGEAGVPRLHRLEAQVGGELHAGIAIAQRRAGQESAADQRQVERFALPVRIAEGPRVAPAVPRDRKSTRLNSSH